MKIKDSLKTINKTKAVYIIAVAVFVVVSMFFNVTPDDNMDAVRHFDVINRVRDSDLSFFEFVFNNTFTKNMARFSYLFYALQYIVARCFTNNYVIVWVSILIDYTIIAYIGYDIGRTTDKKKVVLLFELLLCYSLLPYYQACSGMRTATAACFAALALYKFLYRDKNVLLFAGLMICGVLFHPVVLLAIPFALLAKYFSPRGGICLTVIGSAAIPVAAKIFSYSNNQFIYAVAYKYFEYTSADQYRGTRFCYYGVILICVMYLVYYVLYYGKAAVRKDRNQTFLTVKKESGRDSGLCMYNFVVYYMFFVLTCFKGYELVVRQGYLLGALAPILALMAFDKRSDLLRIKGIEVSGRTALLILILYLSAKYVVHYTKWFV